MKKMGMKMNNKVLVKVDFVEYNLTFEVFIPVNELLWKVIMLIEKSSGDLLGIEALLKNHIAINKYTNEVYDLNLSVKETDIRNGTELLFY